MGPGSGRKVRRGGARGKPHPRRTARRHCEPRGAAHRLRPGQHHAGRARQPGRLLPRTRRPRPCAERRPRNAARRAPQRGVRAARTRGPHRRRPRADGSRGHFTRTGRSRGARRKRVDPGRLGRPRLAQVQPEDLGQLRFARRNRGHGRGEPQRQRGPAARHRRGLVGHERAAIHRPLQRPARHLRDRERQGPRRRFRRT